MPFSHADRKTPATELAAELAPHIAGKTVLVTGVTAGGLGAHYAQTVAAHQPSLLIISGRNAAKNEATAAAIRAAAPAVAVRTLTMDLASLQNVRAAAQQVLDWADVPHIDVLCLNAAIMANPWTKTVDGFESQFATNHLGHFLFANLLVDKLLKAKAPRVVSVASDGHRFSPVRFNDVDFGNGEHYDPWVAYGQSKTANMLFARGLAKRLGPKGLKSFSLHPGVIMTNLAVNLTDFTGIGRLDKQLGTKNISSELVFVSVDQGTANHIMASFDPELTDEYNGYFLDMLRPGNPWTDEVLAWGRDDVDAERLWKLSEEMVGQKFEY